MSAAALQGAAAAPGPAQGADGRPLNLLAGSGDPADASKRRILVEADFVTCTQ